MLWLHVDDPGPDFMIGVNCKSVAPTVISVRILLVTEYWSLTRVLIGAGFEVRPGFLELCIARGPS